MVTVNFFCEGTLIEQFNATNDEVFAFFKGLKNHKYEKDGVKYIMSDCNYNIFDNVVIVTLQKRVMFLHDTFIPNYTNEIVKQLQTLGYSESTVAGTGKHLITSSLGYYYFTDNDYSDGGMGYVAEGTVALAIAAITDNTDINQWFIFPDGSIDFCECNSRVDMWGDFEGTEYPRKMTVNEIYSKID